MASRGQDDRNSNERSERNLNRNSQSTNTPRTASGTDRRANRNPSFEWLLRTLTNSRFNIFAAPEGNQEDEDINTALNEHGEHPFVREAYSGLRQSIYEFVYALAGYVGVRSFYAMLLLFYFMNGLSDIGPLVQVRNIQTEMCGNLIHSIVVVQRMNFDFFDIIDDINDDSAAFFGHQRPRLQNQNHTPPANTSQNLENPNLEKGATGCVAREHAGEERERGNEVGGRSTRDVGVGTPAATWRERLPFLEPIMARARTIHIRIETSNSTVNMVANRANHSLLVHNTPHPDPVREGNNNQGTTRGNEENHNTNAVPAEVVRVGNVNEPVLGQNVQVRVQQVPTEAGRSTVITTNGITIRGILDLSNGTYPVLTNNDRRDHFMDIIRVAHPPPVRPTTSQLRRNAETIRIGPINVRVGVNQNPQNNNARRNRPLRARHFHHEEDELEGMHYDMPSTSRRPPGSRPFGARPAWIRPAWTRPAMARFAWVTPSWTRPSWARPPRARTAWVRPAWARVAAGHPNPVRTVSTRRPGAVISVPTRIVQNRAPFTRTIRPAWSRLDWIRYRWARATRTRSGQPTNYQNPIPRGPINTPRNARLNALRMRSLARQDRVRMLGNRETRGHAWSQRLHSFRVRLYRETRRAPPPRHFRMPRLPR